jgi:RNA polymerase sigma factor (sigma-70 family)
MTEDERLMTCFYAGQDHAFGKICREHRSPLLRTAEFRLRGRLAGRRERAEDLVQETFLCAFGTRRREASRWDASKGTVKNWLYAILKNKAISFLRIKSGKECLDIDFAANEEPARRQALEGRSDGPNSDPSRPLTAREEDERLESAMSRLSHYDRELIHRKYVLAKTQAEIAEEFGFSKPTASRHFARVLRSLRNSAKSESAVRV